MTNSFTRKFPLFVCHLSCFVQQCFKQLVWGRLVSEWRVKQQINLKQKKQNNTANADPCSHSGVKITPLIVQLQARVHSQFTAPPYPEQGISVCVHKYWAIRWKRAPLHSGMGVPTLNAWVTDYFLTSWTSTLYKEEPKPQPEEAKLETMALQIIQNHIVALRTLLHYNTHSCSSSNFKLVFFFLLPPPANLMYSAVIWGTESTAILISRSRSRGRCVRLFPSRLTVCTCQTAGLEKLQRKFILCFKTWVSICEGPFLHKWAHKPQCLFK